MNALQTSLLGLGCAECGGTCSGSYNLGSYGKPIEWNTEPVINDYAWNRDGFWDCNDWMTWHKKVAAKYGVPRANEVFMIWWNKQGDFAYGNDCILLNKTFRDYFKSVGLQLDSLSSFVTKPIDFVFNASGSVLDNTEKVIDNAGNAAANTAGAAESLTKVLKVILPLAVVGVVAGLGYYGYKHYVKGDEKIKVTKPSLSGVTDAPAKKKSHKKIIYI